MRVIPGGGSTRANAQARALAHAHGIASGLADAFDTDARVGGLAGRLSSDLARDLKGNYDIAHDPTLDLGAIDESARGTDRTRYEVLVVATAERLAAAARMLPVWERSRYAEEFRSKLWEMAHVGGRRRTQLAHAARQVISALRLRREPRIPQWRAAP